MQTGTVRWQTRKVLTQGPPGDAAPRPHWVLLRAALAVAVIALPAAEANAAAKCQLGQVIELPITMNSLRPTIPVKINNKDAKFVLDSGAFYSMLSSATASEYGLRLSALPFGYTVQGIGGYTSPSLTTVKEFSVAGVDIKNVQFLVGGSEVGGSGLLGQNFLERFDVEYDLANGAIRLFHTEHCENARLAYWLRPDQDYSSMSIEPVDPKNAHTMGVAYINGQKMRVAFDTGAFTSVLSLKAAERAGVKLDSLGVVAAGYSGGIGRGRVKSYIAPFGSFKIGDSEEIKNARLRIEDTDLSFTDMLLGADFFVSHRIFVGNREHRLFLSYNGGPVFNLARNTAAAEESRDDLKQDAEKDEATQAADPASPGDAADLARRGSALAARRDFTPALQDLSKAIELNPAEPEYYYQRANAYWASGQGDPALADYDHAISLKQDFLPAYIPRAELKLAKKDMAAAILDLDAVDRLAPKPADLRFMLAELDQRIDRLPEAIEQYTLWIQNHPDDSRMMSALVGRCLSSALQNQNLAGALGDCDTAIRHADKTDKSYPYLLVDRGLVRLRQGDYDKAIADFNNALTVMPKNARALYARAVAESRKRQEPQSKADLEAAKTIAPKIAERFERFGLVP